MLVEAATGVAALASWTLAASLLAGCAGKTEGGDTSAGSPDGATGDGATCVTIDVTTYDQACQNDSDCVVVTPGEICSGACACGGATINGDGQARYESAIAPLALGSCMCPYSGAPRCVKNTCTLCLPGPSGTSCDDAGTAIPDASPDAPADVDLDSPLGWLAELDGVWLVGAIGNLNHFSWVRISGAAQMHGVAEFLDGAALTMNAPFWPCNGAGTWMMTQKIDTIGLEFPTSCSVGFAAYTFDSFSAPGAWPKGAILAASITPEGASSSLAAFKFPSSQCDAAMTTCIDPLK